MRFCVVGAGAIGGYLGARLALAGHPVDFIARGRNLAVINAEGFRLIEEDGSERHTRDVRAASDPSTLEAPDAVLLTVKAHQVIDLLPTLTALVGPQTMLVTMVNGVPWWYFQRLAGPWEGRVVESVDPGGVLQAALAADRIIGSVVYPAAELLAPGVVKVVEGQRFSIGELDGSRSERIDALSQALMSAGFKAPVSRDIRSELWVKLWGNLSFNPISALTHATLEDICRFPPTRALAERMMAEAQAVAEALGVRFRITLAQRLAGAEAVGAHKTSMLQDVENGRALELAALVGAVVELGRVTGQPTPTIEAVHAATALLARTLSGPADGGAGRLRVEPLVKPA